MPHITLVMTCAIHAENDIVRAKFAVQATAMHKVPIVSRGPTY